MVKRAPRAGWSTWRSGSALLDRYVRSAVRLAQPFAALPARVPPPSLPVSRTFRFRLDEGPASR